MTTILEHPWASQKQWQQKFVLILVGSSWASKERLSFVREAPWSGKHAVEVGTKHIRELKENVLQGIMNIQPSLATWAKTWHIQDLFCDAGNPLSVVIPGLGGGGSRHTCANSLPKISSREITLEQNFLLQILYIIWLHILYML